VANALYRPGAIKYAFDYGDRKKDPSKITYLHEALEPILSETLGLIAFQEQVMEICKVQGKFTGAQADFMRKAVSKLYRLGKEEAQAEMAPFYDTWMQGNRENNIKDADANRVWGYILEWGGYGFNRSHSESYGLQAYQDMFLKVHYPLALYASVLTTEHKAKKKEQQDFYKNTLREARYFEIDALGPSVNASGTGWGIDGDKLRYGLVSISGMGAGLVQQVLDNRPYEGYRDFIEKVPTAFGADKLVALTQAGAFDELEDRVHLLSLTRQWGAEVAKIKVKMSCGHLKSRTVKVKEPDDDLEALVEDAINDLACPHHPDAVPDKIDKLADTYPMARWYKQHPNGDKPEIVAVPSITQLNEMELEALNVSLTQSAFLLKYKPFLDERIYTEGEIDELPKHPKRKGRKHGDWCTCPYCQESQCVIGGEVTGIKVITTRTKDEMAFMDVAYDANQYSCTLFPKRYEQYKDLLSSAILFLIAGYKDDRNQIVVMEMADVFTVADEQGWTVDNGRHDVGRSEPHRRTDRAVVS
jgi:DNA polymerase III alpha subunit